MRVEFTPLDDSLVSACREFNERLRSHGEPPFLLPQAHAPRKVTRSLGGVEYTHYVALDRTGMVRGGMLLMEQRGWLQNETIRLINIQSPLSEGLFDRRFSGVALQMLRFTLARSPYLYAVGMGHEQNPFPRLLRAAGWSVTSVPFSVWIQNSRRFLHQISPLRHGFRMVLAQIAAASGVSTAMLLAWQLAHRPRFTRHYSLESAHCWPVGLNTIWEQCRQQISLSVLRDEETLASVYPDDQIRLRRFLLRHHGEIVGWSVGIATSMVQNQYFGDLCVGTILDGLASAEHLPALLALTRDALVDLGAELILTNQTHHLWLAELRQLGFLSAPSNYVLATSGALNAALKANPDKSSRMHFSRGDGDGRNHL